MSNAATAFGYFYNMDKYHEAYLPGYNKDIATFVKDDLVFGTNETKGVGHLKGYIPFFSFINACKTGFAELRSKAHNFNDADKKFFSIALLVRRIVEFIPFSCLVLAPIDLIVSFARAIRAVCITASANSSATPKPLHDSTEVVN